MGVRGRFERRNTGGICFFVFVRGFFDRFLYRGLGIGLLFYILFRIEYEIVGRRLLVNFRRGGVYSFYLVLRGFGVLFI